MPRSPQDIYARHLLSPRGYPLWTPEPSHQLLVYRREGLRIGDVGVVIPEDGCFDVFFNICLPRDHPFHRATGVPDNFEPIELDELDIRTIVNAENPGRIISNSSVKSGKITDRTADSLSKGRISGRDYDFTLTSNEGALLILPEGAERHDLRNHHRFLEAATLHGADWYRFADEKVGQIIGNDSLYLITGLYKATSWSLAAFEKTAGTAEYPAQFRLSQAGEDTVTASYTWDTTRALDWRVGPLEKNEFVNQSVFIRGFKVALRTGMFGTRWISVKADTPSTRPNPARSFGTVPGDSDSWLAYLFGGQSASGTTQITGSGTQDEIMTNSALDVARDEIQNKGAVAAGEHVVIRRIPEASQAFHPSDIINRYLLNKEPSAKIAITHDDDWISMLEENLLQPEDLAREGRLETLVSLKYDIISKHGAVYFQGRRLLTGLCRVSRPTIIHSYECKWLVGGIPCDKCFATLEAIMDHLGYVHDVQGPGHRKLICQWSSDEGFCGLEYRRQSFRRHIARHLSITFPCTGCGKHFSREDVLRKHMELHDTPEARKGVRDGDPLYGWSPSGSHSEGSNLEGSVGWSTVEMGSDATWLPISSSPASAPKHPPLE